MCHKLVQFSLFPFVLHASLTMDMKIHDYGQLRAPAPRTVVTSVPPPGSTGSTGHSVPFMLSRSRSAVPSLQRHKSTQHAWAKPRNVPSRATISGPFSLRSTASCSIQPHFWRHFTSGLPSYREQNCRSSSRGAPWLYGPKFHYCPQLSKRSVAGMRFVAHAQIPWHMTSCYYPTWKHSFQDCWIKVHSLATRHTWRFRCVCVCACVRA